MGQQRMAPWRERSTLDRVILMRFSLIKTKRMIWRVLPASRRMGIFSERVTARHSRPTAYESVPVPAPRAAQRAARMIDQSDGGIQTDRLHRIGWKTKHRVPSAEYQGLVDRLMSSLTRSKRFWRALPGSAGLAPVVAELVASDFCGRASSTVKVTPPRGGSCSRGVRPGGMGCQPLLSAPD
jgi:hypothetical protein